MSTHLLSKIGPQQNAISLEAGKEYTHHWQQLLHTLYHTEKNDFPHGIFIPMTDLIELAELQKKVTHVKKNGKEERIYIVGVRAYFCLKIPILVPFPVSAIDYPVAAVLVAVYQTNEQGRAAGSDDEYHYHPGEKTHDLIIPISSAAGAGEADDNGDYTIYDITQPCPNLCDTESPLYKTGS
jgi:hypothetical protein